MRTAAAAAAVLLLLAGAVRADVETLTLYQKTARASLIARTRALSDATRHPRLQVLEVYKGIYTDPTLQVVPTWIDFTDPLPGVEREVFHEGEESIVFLTPYVDEFGRPGEADTFSVLAAADGKIDVPSEGAGALIEAIRNFVAILSLHDGDAQARALRGLVGASNPFLIEAGVAECRRFRFVLPEDSDAVLALMEHPRPDFRAGALTLGRILVQDFVPGTAAGGSVADRERLFAASAAAAQLDTSAEVRTEAVRALEAFGDRAALTVLEQVGRNDTSQSVRYQAQVAAYHLRERLD